MMLKNEAAAYLAGITSDDESQAEAPTNLHMLTGEVISTSEDGLVKVAIDGLMFSEEDEQSVEIETTGGLEEGDIATILLSGEDGRGMAPFSIGAQGSVDRIVAHQIEADELIAQKAEIEDLEAAEARIGTLEVGKADISDLTAATGRITNLETNKADISDLTAATGRITNLETNKADISDLTAATGRITNLETNKADVSDLTAATGRITNLETGKADIDAANITTATLQNAWVDQILVQTGLIANNANIFTLDAIQVNAASIKSGTIDVERLIVTGQDGHKYMIHVDGQGTASYEKLDGDIIEDLTITADKIVANTITASQITTQNLVGTNGWINLHSGTFSYGTVATGGNGISWDGTDLVINGSVLVGQNQVTLPSIATTASTALANAADAEKVATNYIYAGSDGIKIANSNPSTATTYQHQTATKTEFFVDGASAGEFGASGARIGKTTESHAEVDYHSLQLVDKEGDTYFFVSDLRNSDGWVDIEEEIRPATSPYTSSTEFALSFQATDANYVVTVDGIERTTGIRKYVTRFLFDDPIPLESYEIIASYRTESQNAKAFTFGSRFNNSDIGGLSFSEGYGVEASGTYSHSEGYISHATGYGSHAEGNMTWAEGSNSHAEGNSGHAWGRNSHKEGGNNVASGFSSHAEGTGSQASGYASHAEGSGLAAASYSHAEGYLTNATGQGGSNHAEGSRTTASGAASHAEGYQTTASGDYSHTGGEGTNAASAWQTVIGKYNEVDGSGRFPLIIGNGTDENNLSNALTVDWSGGVELQNAVTVYSPTIEDDTTYSSNVGGNGLVMRNGSETFVGQIRAYARSGADRLRGLQIGGFNEAATSYNYLYLMVDKDGNRIVQVSEVAPWLDMLGLSVSSTTAAGVSGGTVNIVRSGKVVTVQCTGLKLASALSNNTTSATLATVPSGYRPPWNVYGVLAVASVNAGGSYVRIDSAGAITVRNQSGSSMATSLNFATTITYIIN